MTPIVVFDIDGTLSDYAHRTDLARLKEWEMFHAQALHDEPIVHVVDLLVVLAQHAEVWLLTGRPEKFRAQTMAWLNKHGLATHVERLLMREDDDYRTSAEMKPAMLVNEFFDADEMLRRVWFVVEDNDRSAESLRNAGLTVLQSAANGY